jgi:hypothetical protein
MTPLEKALSLIGGAVDLVFDAIGSLVRVTLRGAFEPDQYSFRSPRFVHVTSDEVLVQTIGVNAADRNQAKKIVQTDPERYLPMSQDIALFDIVGPVDETAIGLSASPDRKFVIGQMRRETAGDIRKSRSNFLSGGIEGIVFRPSNSSTPLLFASDDCVKMRQRRRIAIALSIALGAWVSTDLYGTWRERLDASVGEADRERLQLEHRLRRTQREIKLRSEVLKGIDTRSVSLSDAVELLDRLTARMPPASGVNSLRLTPAELNLSISTYRPVELELELRRGFQGMPIETSMPESEALPVTGQATLSLASSIAAAPK